MNTEKLILPISIVIGCLILGFFYYTTQVSKQESQEKELIADRQLEYIKFRTPACEKLAKEYGASERAGANRDRYIYSPLDDKCIYETVDASGGERYHTLYDLFTKEEIISSGGKITGTDFQKLNKDYGYMGEYTQEDCRKTAEEYNVLLNKYFNNDSGIASTWCADTK